MISTYGYPDIRVTRKPTDVVEYELARDYAEEAWEEYVSMCDYAPQDLLNEKLETCKRLQARAWKLSQQLNCVHPPDKVERIGTDVFVGDWYHREREQCLVCGKESFHLNDIIVVTAEDSGNVINLP